MLNYSNYCVSFVGIWRIRITGFFYGFFEWGNSSSWRSSAGPFLSFRFVIQRSIRTMQEIPIFPNWTSHSEKDPDLNFAKVKFLQNRLVQWLPEPVIQFSGKKESFQRFYQWDSFSNFPNYCWKWRHELHRVVEVPLGHLYSTVNLKTKLLKEQHQFLQKFNKIFHRVFIFAEYRKPFESF